MLPLLLLKMVQFIIHMLGNGLIRSNLAGCSIVKRITWVILVGGKFFQRWRNLWSLLFGILSSWGTNCSLGINFNKIHLVLFLCRYKIDTFRLPMLSAKELPLFSKVMYLGVVLHSKLNWNETPNLPPPV